MANLIKVGKHWVNVNNISHVDGSSTSTVYFKNSSEFIRNNELYLTREEMEQLGEKLSKIEQQNASKEPFTAKIET